jgi:phosphomevalonate kinase
MSQPPDSALPPGGPGPPDDAPLEAPPAPPPGIRIPGKVMLSGEYAVLHEGTAVMLPVPRWLYLAGGGELARPGREDPADRPRTLPGSVPTGEGRASPAPTAESPVVQAARRVYLPGVSEFEKLHAEPPVVVDAGEFSVADAKGQLQKLGLGSSAAEAVGVIALRYACAGQDWTQQRERVFAAALDAHARAQGGLGSGADVAACAYGVPLRFRRSLGEIELRPIPPPPAAARLPLALAWSGASANSRVLVEKYLVWRSMAGAEARSAEQYLVRRADELAEAWFTAGPEALLAALDEFCDVLAAIAEQAELTWKLPVHARLDAWARRYGGRAKPTGAGGGDMALLVGDLPLEKLGLPTIVLDYDWLWPETS